MVYVLNYIVFQIVATIGAILFIICTKGYNLQFAVLFFPLSAVTFISSSFREWEAISQYLKDNNPGLYKKRSIHRPYYPKDLFAVNIFGITEKELLDVNNDQIVARIQKIKLTTWVILVTMFLVFILLVIKSYAI